jgi:hypothetical protein
MNIRLLRVSYVWFAFLNKTKCFLKEDVKMNFVLEQAMKARK